MIREEARICNSGNLEGGGRKLVSFPNFVPSSMDVTVFGGLVCGLYVENLEAGHFPGGSLYAQVLATFSSFVVQVPVFIWWVMVFGFASGGSIYLVAGGVFLHPCGGGRQHLAPSLVVFLFYSGGSGLSTLHTAGFLNLGEL